MINWIDNAHEITNPGCKPNDDRHRLGRDACYADASQAPRFIASAERFARGP